MIFPNWSPALPVGAAVDPGQCFHPTGTSLSSKKKRSGSRFPSGLRKLFVNTLTASRSKQGPLPLPTLSSMRWPIVRPAPFWHSEDHRPNLSRCFFEKGIEQIVTMLGILKAGKFFVLLDATSPRARIAEIAGGLTSRRFDDRQPEYRGGQNLCEQ